jgi:hypothetical protein
VYIIGDSAGAHMAALTALIHASKALQDQYHVEGTSLKIRALGLSCGVYDFDRLLNDPYDIPMRKVLMETIFDRIDQDRLNDLKEQLSRRFDMSKLKDIKVD